MGQPIEKPQKWPGKVPKRYISPYSLHHACRAGAGWIEHPHNRGVWHHSGPRGSSVFLSTALRRPSQYHSEGPIKAWPRPKTPTTPRELLDRSGRKSVCIQRYTPTNAHFPQEPTPGVQCVSQPKMIENDFLRTKFALASLTWTRSVTAKTGQNQKCSKHTADQGGVGALLLTPTPHVGVPTTLPDHGG